MAEKIIDVKGFGVKFLGKHKEIEVIRNLDLQLYKEKIVAIIGESGCGKSVLVEAMLKLLPDNASIAGEVFYKSKNLAAMSPKQIERIRGSHIGFVMQNPQEAMNGLVKVGKQLENIIRLDHDDKAFIDKKIAELIDDVELSEHKHILDLYPHELSGGMQQRFLIAMGLARDPEVLFADEPTKGLDLVTRNQIATLLYNYSKNKKKTLFFVTHDVHLAKRIADRIIVMYSGQIIEDGDKETIFNEPKHPYLQMLLKSLPENGLVGIDGIPLPLSCQIDACKFYDRCPKKSDLCKQKTPVLKEYSTDHWARCVL